MCVCMCVCVYMLYNICYMCYNISIPVSKVISDSG